MRSTGSLVVVLLLVCIFCPVRYTESRASGVIEQVSQNRREPGHDPEEAEYHKLDHDKSDHHHRPDYHGHERSRFILENPMKVIRTEAGEMKVLPRKDSGELTERNVGLNFLIMEPNAQLLPQYIDGSCVFLVHKGRARLSWVDDGNLQETHLEVGDIYKIEGGTVFYILNTDDDHRLEIFSIFDTSTRVFQPEVFQSSFVAGGEDPRTILSGFDNDVIAAAMKVSLEEVRDVLSSQTQGPIIYATRNATKKDSTSGAQSDWSFKRLLGKYVSLFASSPSNSPPKPYNILRKTPDFRNDYGWSVAVDGEEVNMLKEVNKGVFAVSLKAGALMAPHWNPTAMEIALVTKGEGVIQISHPNGTVASNEKVQEGMVFFVPQYYPMCQIASSSGGSFEFMGFSTSAARNRPQFLAGSNSVLKAMNMDILAAAFNIPADHLKRFVESQTEAVIIPGEN